MKPKSLILGAVFMLLGAPAAFAFPPIDLTVSGATYLSASDGTYWEQQVTQPTGTGVFDPFLRVRENGVEEGMNTDAMPEIMDNVGGGDPHTHSFTLGTLATSSADFGNGNQAYYRFVLDLNEPNGGGKNMLSLDEILIYTAPNAAGGSMTSLAEVQANGGVLRYNLDGISDQDVYLNHKLAEGSGKSDMAVWIPASFFAGASSSDYVYFYSKFGDSGGKFEANFDSEAGFEEWAAMTGGGSNSPPPGSLPEPGTALLLSTGVLGLAVFGSRRR